MVDILCILCFWSVRLCSIGPPAAIHHCWSGDMPVSSCNWTFSWKVMLFASILIGLVVEGFVLCNRVPEP